MLKRANASKSATYPEVGACVDEWLPWGYTPEWKWKLFAEVAGALVLFELMAEPLALARE